MKASALTTLFASVACAAAAQAASPPLIVHEWGTFTSFQDEQGRTIPGINVDDEPVPSFVHRMAGIDIFQGGSLPASWSQGAPRCHPDVTMRLETPVLYFYPPAGWEPVPFDVHAAFNGGWLTEFYPFAKWDGVNFPRALDANERGSLQWSQMRLDPAAGALMPETSENVWLAPRKVASAVIVEPNAKEAEKYLFYRGVGHIDAPLVIRRTRDSIKISLREDENSLASLPRLWIVDVGPNGHVRHRTLNPAGRTVETAAFVGDAGAAASSLPELRRELAQALTSAGLYADEAAAMLETWRLSYFESEGLRVFFVLPQTWTEAHLPLSISTPADVTRLMVGRVELVTDRQRARLDKLLALQDEEFPKLPLYYDDPAVLKLMRGGAHSHAALYRETGREVPVPLRIYDSLGRFRDALLAHELQASEGARRTRLERIARSFSACIPVPTVTDGSLSTNAK
jgi:hypothetical protein